MIHDVDLTEPVLGFLDVPGTDPVPVMVHDTGGHFELTMEYNYQRADLRNQWITNYFDEHHDVYPISHIPPNQRIDPRNTMPHALHVTAEGRPLTFMDYLVSPKRLPISSDHETVVVRANHVLAGWKEDDESGKISGLCSVIPGLLAWTGLTSITSRPTENGDGQGITVTMNNPIGGSLVLDRERGLSLTPDARYHEYALSEASGEISQYIRVESHTQEPRDWDRHLELHRDLKALVSLAAYQPLIFLNMEVPPDQEHPLGRKVLSHRPEVDPSAVLRLQPRFLFYFRDIKTEGIGKWLDLYDQCPQGINGLNYLIENSVHIALEPHYLMMCIAFEKIGYFIHNKDREKKEEQCFVDYLQTIIDDISIDGKNIPLSYPETETWKTNTNKLYKDIKHAGRNHTQPEAEHLLKHLNEGILLMRVWIAKYLGCDMQNLFKNLHYDQQVNKYQMFREIKPLPKETKTDVQQPDKSSE